MVIDRYWLSTRVYAPTEAMPALDGLEAQVVPPTLTLFANAPETVRRARLTGRGGTLTRADLETLVGRRAEVLTRKYRAWNASPMVGEFVELDCSGSANTVLATALAAVWEAGRRAA